ncbi:hypothetical protein CIL05_07480 [Virgibacillus profundi]|uniref:Uncharacterized protein n=1 Tax=Virgibacillus profundi TaxID=2024555 RepID=A0A2A2IFH2_9BACI|nr:hypothetical protein [Virgibacillus profundi]PAV30302.1 hypothetical protein CIL05_07480 [Virgibacillus profundi]PXY54474.1 hypothetical protein CIT14_07565 [Virgibacillus profundi]
MEILTQTEHTFQFYFIILLSILSILFLLFLGIGTLVEMISKRKFTPLGIFGVTFALCLTAIIVFGVVMHIDRGAEVTYKATVDDFNEVYESGYKVIGQEDKIYLLKKID